MGRRSFSTIIMCHTLAAVFLFDQVAFAASPRMIRASGPLARKTAAVKASAMKTSSVKVKGSAATALVNPTGSSISRTGTGVNSLVYPNGRGSSSVVSNSNAANSLVYPGGVPSNPNNSSSSSSWLPILGIGAVAGIALLAMFGGNLFGGGSSSGNQPTDWSSTPDSGGGGTPPPPPEDLGSTGDHDDTGNDQKVAGGKTNDAVTNVSAPADSQPELMKTAKQEAGVKDDSSGAADDPKNAKDRKLEQKTAEQKTEKKEEKKPEKKVASHVKTCGRDLASYNRDANLSGNLAELLENNDLKDGSSYTWRTSQDPVNVRIRNGNIQIYVSKFGEWDTIRQICSDGTNTSLKFKANKDSYDIQVDIKKNGSQFTTETFLMGSSPMSLGTATIGTGALSVNGDREIASQSHGGLQ